MRNNKNLWCGVGFGVSTAILIGAYLSGMIIEIPHGTHEGGIKSGIGVGIILLGMLAIATVWYWLSEKCNSK